MLALHKRDFGGRRATPDVVTLVGAGLVHPAPVRFRNHISFLLGVVSDATNVKVPQERRLFVWGCLCNPQPLSFRRLLHGLCTH